MQTRPLPGVSHATIRPMAYPTLMEVLRTHGLRELKLLDAATLRLYSAFLADKISGHERTLRTNIQKGFAAEIRQDIRYFQTIQDEVNTLLTAAFNAK